MMNSKDNVTPGAKSVRDPWELHQIQPSELTCQRTLGGTLAVKLGGQVNSGVEVTQAFPRSSPGRFLAFFDREGQELGMLDDLATLDAASQEAILTELRLRYVRPVVTSIARVRQEPGSWTFDLVTDRGPMRLCVRNLHEHLVGLGADRMILTDVDGRACEISSIHALDAHSRRELGKIL